MADDDDRGNMRWGGVTIVYFVAPYLDTPFKFSTCVERTKGGLIHNEIGMTQVVQNLIRMRKLKFPINAVKPQTIYRTPLLLADGSPAGANSESDSSSDQSSDSDSDSDDNSEVVLPSYKYSVMAGPDMFNPKKEAVVLFGSLINGLVVVDEMKAGGAIAMASNGAPLVPSSAGGGGGGDSDSDADGDGEPSSIFEHKLYDDGSYIKELEQKLKSILVGLSEESDGKDPNAAIFKRIICECFLPWSIPGFNRRPCGILLHGPPGNGKSFMVDSYIREKLGMTFTGLNYASSRFSGGKVGEGERKMRKEAAKCFEDRQMLYCMFIDEIDTVGGDRNRKENEGYKTDYLNQLLAIIGQRNYQNLFVIGATNYKDKLDAALVRDGRLENHYYLPSMDKHRRLDHLSRKLAGAMTSLVGNGITISTMDVRRVLDSNKPVLGYLVRNTINFTFAQFDRLCSDIEGYLRIHFWAKSMATVSALAEWLPEIVEHGFQYGPNGQLIMLAKDQMIKTCLDGTVKKAVDSYFKGNSMENLAYNRAALDTSAATEIVHEYNAEVKQFFTRESEYHSGVAPPTGRYMINISTKRSPFPELVVELARNPCLTSSRLFSEKRIQLKNVFFNDSIISKMIQPVVQSRSYEFIQIVDRETVQLGEEDKIYETLKGKYEEAATLAENGTAGLIIIRLNDLVGHILQVLKTKTTSKSTRSMKENIRTIEKTFELHFKDTAEDTERLSYETQIRSSIEGALLQSLLVTQESMEAAEDRMENNNQGVETKQQKSTESERLTRAQEQNERVTDTKTERMAEMHLATHRQMMRHAKDFTNKATASSSSEDKMSSSKSSDRINEVNDRVETTNTNTRTLTQEDMHLQSTQSSKSLDNNTNSQSQVTNTAGNNQKNSTNGSTDTLFDTQGQMGHKNDTKSDESFQDMTSREIQNQTAFSKQDQNQQATGLTLSDVSQSAAQQQHSDNSSTTNFHQLQSSNLTQQQSSNAAATQHQDVDSHNYQGIQQSTTAANGDYHTTTTIDSKLHNTITNQDGGNQLINSGHGSNFSTTDTYGNDNQRTFTADHITGNYSTTGQYSNQGFEMITNSDPYNKTGPNGDRSTLFATGGTENGEQDGGSPGDMTIHDDAKGHDYEQVDNYNFTNNNQHVWTHGKQDQTQNNTNGNSQTVTGTQDYDTVQNGKQTIDGQVNNTSNGNTTTDSHNHSDSGSTTITGTDTRDGTTTTTDSGQNQHVVTQNGDNSIDKTHSDQSQSTNTLTGSENQTATNNQTDTASRTHGLTNNNVLNGFGGNTDNANLTNKNVDTFQQQGTLENKLVDSKMASRTVDNKVSNTNQRDVSTKSREENSSVESRNHGISDTIKTMLSNQMEHSVVNTVSNVHETLSTESKSDDLSNEVREEGERSKLLQLVAEESVRSALNAEAAKLLEQSLSEEYRQTAAKNMTQREQIQKEIKKEQSQNTTTNQSSTNTDLNEKTLTMIRENVTKLWDKDVNEIRTSNADEVRDETIVKDEILRPKILDVVSRFAGLTSKYLNSFDAKKGPDILFVVEDDSLADMLKFAIQWGEMKPSRPTTAVAIPDYFLTKYYESSLSTFWIDSLSSGKLTNIKVVLTASEKEKKTGMRPFDFIPHFLSLSIGNKGKVSDNIKKFEFEGCFAIADSVFYAKHAKFLNAMPNLTIIKLVSMALTSSVFQGFKRLKTDDIGLSCPNLVELELHSCRLPIRSINSLSTNSVLLYDPESILCYLTGAEYFSDVQMPKLKRFSVAYPVASSINHGRLHIWDLPGSACINFVSTLRSLDLTRHQLKWSALEYCLSNIGLNLHTLILDGCIVADFKYQIGNVNRFIEHHLPEELQGLVRRPALRKKSPSVTESSRPDNDDGFFVNGHNVKPDCIYFLLVYWSEAKREELAPAAFSFVGY